MSRDGGSPARPGGGARPWLAPQVLQTSAMDCGPAVLASALRGYGLPADPEALREVCSTGMDGTSIDVLTDLAAEFGLNARQLVVPADHLGAPGRDLLPAIAITELPGGLLHFVVVWRIVGRWAMVMDPAVGRRWLPIDSLRDELYTHEMSVPTSAWRDYAATEAFTGPLAANLSAVGIDDETAAALIREALADPRAGAIARLDAAARRARRSGWDAQRCIRAGTGEVSPASWNELADDSMVDVDVDAAAGANGEYDRLRMRGVVLLSIEGVDPSGTVNDELVQQVLRPEPSAMAVIGALLSSGGRGRLAASIAALVVASIGTVGTAFLLEQVVVDRGRAGTALAVLGICAALTVAGRSGVLGAGRRLELALRRSVDERTADLPDRFFRTRTASDLAERAHSMHRLRELPTSAADLAAATGQVLAACVGLAVLAGSAAWVVALVVAVVVVATVGFWSLHTEREHRARTIGGAMNHVYLDALAGALPLRAHRAGGAVRVEHIELLRSWSIAERARHRLAGISTASVLTAGYLAAVLSVVVIGPRVGTGSASTALVAFLAFVAASSGLDIGRTLRRTAAQWVVARRLLALSAAPVDRTGSVPAGTGPAGTAPAERGLPGIERVHTTAVEGAGPAAIELRSVTVNGDGGPVLDDVSLRIEPGEHVGIVGSSGAGKSTLVATILGWTDPADGEVVVDDIPLDPARAARLRRVTGWVDPDVAIWAGSLADNLIDNLVDGSIDRAADAPAGASGDSGSHPIAPAGASGWDRVEPWASQIGLDRVLARLDGPGGLVGESGRLLSGGEAQRVRIAKTFARSDVRLLVLDEATRGLDVSTAASVDAAIAERFAGVTTLSVTHDLEHALTLPRVIHIDGGRVVADGPPVELMADPDNAFAQMVAAHRAFAGSLDAADGWSTIHVGDGAVRCDPAPVEGAASAGGAVSGEPALLDPVDPVDPSPGSPRSPGPVEPAGSPGQVETGGSAGIGRDRMPGLRPALLVAAAAAVVVALEWALFVVGWSRMVASPRGAWWPVLFAGAGIAAGVSTWLFGLASLHLARWLRRRLLDGAVAAPLERVRRLGSGGLNGRVLEAETFEATAVAGGTDALFGGTQVVAAVVVALLVGATGTAVAIVGWTVALLVVAWAGLSDRRRWTIERIDRTRLLIERFRGHRTESVYGPPAHAGPGRLDRYSECSRRSDRWSVALGSAAEVWLFVGIAVAVATGGALASAGGASSAETELLGGIGAVLLAWSGFASLAPATDDVVTAAAASGEFAELARLARPARLDHVARVAPTGSDAPPVDGAVAATGLRVVAPGSGVPLIAADRVELAQGSRTVIRGDSGAGKSTLAMVLAGLRPADGGVVSGAEQVVYVPQFGDNHTFEGPVAFNLLMGRRWFPGDADLDAATQMIVELGLSDVVGRMPRGLAQPVGESGWPMSHGERGRMYLARALLQGGDVVVMDESLEGLDPVTARAVLDSVLARTRTVALVSHH